MRRRRLEVALTHLEGEVARAAGEVGVIYLAGGMAAKLMPHTDTQPFLEAFFAKREHRALASSLPVYLLTDEDLGLKGALALAAANAAGAGTTLEME